jgi:putative transposase
MRIIAYNFLGNHFHFLLWPVGDNDTAWFMKWLEQTHARRFHLKRGSVGCGAVFQSRYVSRRISEDRKVFAALIYVEANARRHGVVRRAEDWPWGSAWNRASIGPYVAIDDSPIPRPSNWLEILNNY